MVHMYAYDIYAYIYQLYITYAHIFTIIAILFVRKADDQYVHIISVYRYMYLCACIYIYVLYKLSPNLGPTPITEASRTSSTPDTRSRQGCNVANHILHLSAPQDTGRVVGIFNRVSE